MSSGIVYLLVGATGKQGGALHRTLVSSPAFTASPSPPSIRFITRDPSSAAAQKLVAQGSTPVQADLNDKAAVLAALKGVDRAFLVTDAAAGEEKEEIQGRLFIDAAKEAGVKHLVFTSVGGADVADNVPHFRSKFRVEQYLHQSNIPYTILRPVAFMDNFPLAPSFARFMTIGAFFSLAGSKPVQFIAVEDIGIIGAKALLDPTSETFHNKTIALGVGEYSLGEVEEAIYKAQGSRPWVARWFPKVVRSVIPHDFAEMMKFFEYKGFPPSDYDLLRKIHPGLMTMEDWVKKNSPQRAE